MKDIHLPTVIVGLLISALILVSCGRGGAGMEEQAVSAAPVAIKGQASVADKDSDRRFGQQRPVDRFCAYQ